MAPMAVFTRAVQRLCLIDAVPLSSIHCPLVLEMTAILSSAFRLVIISTGQDIECFESKDILPEA